MSESKILVCTGFHRSATSATANYLLNAGLDMGHKLMGGNISNKGGHFEDWPVVELHDDWLALNQTDWQFHDDIDLAVSEDSLIELDKYIASRDATGKDWGVKDPRGCLFLPEWNSVLGDRGHYLFVLRHWSSSVESLLHRHSRELAYAPTINVESKHFTFWKSPTLAARMWLSYCKRLLAFARAYPSKTLLVTQRALFEGQPLIPEINSKFQFFLNEEAESPYRTEWLRDKASKSILKILPQSLVSELDHTWQSLLVLTTLKHVDENPVWIDNFPESQNDIKQWLNDNSDILTYSSKMVAVDKESTQLPEVKASELLALLELQDGEESISKLFDEALFKEMRIKLNAFEAVYEWCHSFYSTSTQVFIALSLWLQRHKQWSLAIKAWHWCLSLNPVYPYMYYQLAQTYKAIGNSSLAMYFAKQAAEKNPNNPSFIVLQAQLFREAGDVLNALETFENATKLGADKPGIMLPYCDLLEQEGHIEKAQAIIASLLKHQPENQGVKNMSIRLALKLDDKQGDSLYFRNKKELLLKYTQEQRKQVLLKYLSNTGCQASEKDLFSRVMSHWSKVGLEE